MLIIPSGDTVGPVGKVKSEFIVFPLGFQIFSQLLRRRPAISNLLYPNEFSQPVVLRMILCKSRT